MKVADDPAYPSTSVELNCPKDKNVPGAHFTNVTFQSLSGKVHKNTIRALTSTMGFKTMTVVQAATIEIALSGRDVLARARTGTGKTVAFMIPSVEAAVRLVSVVSRGVFVFVLSPTRELASQIESATKELLTFHTNVSSVVMVGGTSFTKDERILQGKNCPAIIVGTPGRMLDHLQKNTGGLKVRLEQLQILVLDEADQLLDMGFRNDLEKIMNFLPPPAQRQTLLFSATLPPAVHQIKHIALRNDHEFVDTVGEDNEHTHSHVQQGVMVCKLEQHLVVIESLLTDLIKVNDFKVIIFCNTARSCGYLSALFSEVLSSVTIKEIHSRKTQRYRTKVSNEFRDGKNMLLFSSDVSARGVDYPNVTAIIQIGLVTDRQQYVHRLGRTARGDSNVEGRGILLLSDFEEKCMKKELSDLPLDILELHSWRTTPSHKLQQVLRDLARNSELTVAAEQ
eukprot:Pgem_evm1s116